MTLKNTIMGIAEEKGATTDTILSLALGFIEKHDLHNQFTEHVDLELEPSEPNDLDEIVNFQDIMDEWFEDKDEYDDEFGVFICNFGLSHVDDPNTIVEEKRVAVIAVQDSAEKCGLIHLRKDVNLSPDFSATLIDKPEKIDMSEFTKDTLSDSWVYANQ